MGMFDYVNFEMDCPECGEKVEGFQSKSAGCTLEILDPGGVSNMHAPCKGCGLWIELTRQVSPKEPRKTPYTLEEVEEMGFRIIFD